MARHQFPNPVSVGNHDRRATFDCPSRHERCQTRRARRKALPVVPEDRCALRLLRAIEHPKALGRVQYPRSGDDPHVHCAPFSRDTAARADRVPTSNSEDTPLSVSQRHTHRPSGLSASCALWLVGRGEASTSQAARPPWTGRGRPQRCFPLHRILTGAARPRNPLVSTRAPCRPVHMRRGEFSADSHRNAACTARKSGSPPRAAEAPTTT